MSIYDDFYAQPAPLDRKQLWLESLAERYHRECDAYDEQVCTGRYKGEAIPMNPGEQAMINDNTVKVKNKILADNPGITPEELHGAIVAYRRKN